MEAGDHDQTVAALRSELHERAAAEAALRGQLVEARAELDGCAAGHSRLEAAQHELRGELDELRALIERQAAHSAVLEAARDRLTAERELLAAELTQLRDGLAASTVASEAATSEAAGLRAELDRLGAELSHARAGDSGRDPGVIEARSLLAEARALRAMLAGDEPPAGAMPAGDEGAVG